MIAPRIGEHVDYAVAFHSMILPGSLSSEKCCYNCSSYRLSSYKCVQISCSNSFEMLAAFKTLYPFIVHLQVSFKAFICLRCNGKQVTSTAVSLKSSWDKNHMQGAQGIHLLLIDNIAAYHWLDYPVKAQPRVQGQASSDLTLQVWSFSLPSFENSVLYHHYLSASVQSTLEL